jgi:hypothetical protein
MSKDPPFDDADKALLDQAVRGLRDELPDDLRMRRLERLIAPVLATPPAPAPWWMRGRARVITGAAVVLALSGAMVAARHSEIAASSSASSSNDAPLPAATTRPPNDVPLDPPPHAAPPTVSVESLPAAAPMAPGEAKARRAPEAPRADRAAEGAPAEDPGDELALLEDARRSLASDPARTLALADAHAKRFREPALAQERERLAIDALVRLGRTAEAETRAKAFEATYPHSAHLARVRALVAPRVEQ